MNRPTNQKAHIIDSSIKRKFTYHSIEVLRLDITYPQIWLNDNFAAEDQINKYYQREMRKYFIYAAGTLYQNAVEHYHESTQNDYPFHAYDAVTKYTVTLNEACHLSAYFDRYEYTGGAHGSTLRFSQNWDLQTGRKLKLRELFRNSDQYQNQILAQIIRIADSEAESGIYFENYKELIVKYFNPESFYLTPTGVTIYYQQYEVGPYASGIIVFDIPFENLGIKKPSCI